jgi:WD40 repeat protein
MKVSIPKLVVVVLALLVPLACVTEGAAAPEREAEITQSAEGAAVETGGGHDTPEHQHVAVFPQLGHTNYIVSVAFSPDGKQIVSGSWDTTLKLWDAATGREIRTFAGHSDWVRSVAFSPDGQQVLSGSGDKTLKLWDAATGREIRTFSGHSNRVNSVAFSPDGKQALSGSNDNTLKLWDIATGREIRTFFWHSPVDSAAFSPDGKRIVSSHGGIAGLWEAATGREVRTFSVTGTSFDSFAAFSPDGKYIVSGPDNSTFKLWEASTGREIRTFAGHLRPAHSAAFSPDGKQIVSYSSDLYDKTIRLWEAATGREIRSFSGHSTITTVAFSPDGKRIVSGSGDNTLKLWETATGREIHSFSGHSMEVRSAAFSPDGKQILSGSDDKTLKLWEAATGREIHSFSGHSAEVRSVAFSPDGKQALSGSGDKTLKLWEAATGREIRTFEWQTDSGSAYFSLAFSPDGKQIVSSSDDKTLKLWDAATGREIRTFSGHSFYVSSVAFSPDGKQIVSGSRTLKLWDAATGREIRTLSGHSWFVYSVAFSPDGKQIVSGSDDKTLKLWEAATGREIRTFSGHSGWVNSAAFSPDGKRIVSGSGDKTLKLWEAATGREISTLIGHLGGVNSAAFSPDGKQVLSGSADGTIRLWDAATGAEIAQFVSFTDGEWLAMTPEGYYNASPKGDRYINVRIGSEVYGIDQYREALYRPELVAAKLADSGIRLADAGAVIQNAAFQPPLVTIRSPQNNRVLGEGYAQLAVAINGSTQALRSVRVLVNGRLVGSDELKALSGSKGLTVSAGRLNLVGSDTQAEFRLPVALQPGENRIEVLAGNGYSEGRAAVLVNYTGAQSAKPDVWILAIGVSAYEDAAIPSLKYSVKDVQGIVAAFKAQEGKRYGRVNALSLADGALAPTAENIRDNLAFLQKAGPRDIIVLFISGHGVSDEQGKFLFLPRDAVFQADGTVRPSRAISNDELMSIRDLPGQKLVFIDSCYSEGIAGKRVRQGDSFQLVNSLQDAGMVIFTSSGQNEISMEWQDFGYSLFSYSLIQGLSGKADADKNGRVSLTELEGYVKTTVSGLNPRQHPYLWTRGDYKNFILTEQERE